MRELEKIERGELTERLFEYIDEWLNKRINTNLQSLENRDFSSLEDVSVMQEKIRISRDFKHKLESWIKEKDKILDKRNKDNNR